MNDLSVAIANAMHLDMSGGEHGNAFEPGDECRSCIDLGETLAPGVARFVYEWLLGESGILFTHSPDAWAVMGRVMAHWEDSEMDTINGEERPGTEEAKEDMPQHVSLKEFLDAQEEGPHVECSNCKYWDRESPPPKVDYIGADWRCCLKSMDDEGTAIAFSFDGGSYLFTAPTHSCSMWEVAE